MLSSSRMVRTLATALRSYALRKRDDCKDVAFFGNDARDALAELLEIDVAQLEPGTPLALEYLGSTEFHKHLDKAVPLDKITCQTCIGRDKEEGCESCGGYKVILEKSKTPCCQKEYWTRPGCYTAYEGKSVTSTDGLALVWRSAKGLVCKECDDKKAES